MALNQDSKNVLVYIVMILLSIVFLFVKYCELIIREILF